MKAQENCKSTERSLSADVSCTALARTVNCGKFEFVLRKKEISSNIMSSYGQIATYFIKYGLADLDYLFKGYVQVYLLQY